MAPKKSPVPAKGKGPAAAPAVVPAPAQPPQPDYAAIAKADEEARARVRLAAQERLRKNALALAQIHATQPPKCKHPCLSLLSSISGPPLRLTRCLVELKKRPSQRALQKKKEMEEAETPASTPPKPKMSVEEAKAKIREHRKAQEQIRKQQQQLSEMRLAKEMQRAEEEAFSVRNQALERRLERNEEMKRRLQIIEDRKAERELQHEISQRRVQKVLKAHKAFEALRARQVEETAMVQEQETHDYLAANRQKQNHSVLDGLDEVRLLLKESHERSERRERERREYLHQMDQHKPDFYQSPFYEQQMEDFVKARHGHEDDRYRRMYKQTKMREYGHVMTELHRNKLAKKRELQGDDSPPPPMSKMNGTQGTSSLSPKSKQERDQIGEDYLREAFPRRSGGVNESRDSTDSKKPPPGLKLAPLQGDELKREEERDFVERRKKIGHKYLQEIRDLQLPKSVVKEEFRKARAIDELKHLRWQTNNLERKILYGSEHAVARESTTAESLRTKSQTSSLGSNGVSSNSMLETPRYGNGEPEHSYIDVINAKIEMLKRAEELRKQVALGAGKWD